MEESSFIEGLSLFGRNWKKIAEHIGTRDPRAVSSHAQKHFVKLWCQSAFLPEAVARSGLGYTLSGKPLDPESSAVKAYASARVRDEMKAKNPAGVAPGILYSDGSVEQVEASAITRQDDSVSTTSSSPKGSAAVKTNSSEKSTNLTSNKPRSKRKKADSNDPPFVAGSASKAVSRPTRQSRRVAERAHQDKFASQEQDDEVSLEFVHCSRYSTRGQPFRVLIDEDAILVCDLHAHLVSVEIIGFLAGNWDSQTKTISIRKAFPCRSMNSGSDQVEMDPASEVELRDLISRRNMEVVGWYHSHPEFPPKPSNRDVENQLNYQGLFRKESGEEPFVGLIVGTYDILMPSTESILTYFNVKRVTVSLLMPTVLCVHLLVCLNTLITSKQKQVRTPMHLDVELKPCTSIPDETLTQMVPAEETSEVLILLERFNQLLCKR